MKKIFSVNTNSNTTGIALLIARIGIAALMLTPWHSKIDDAFIRSTGTVSAHNGNECRTFIRSCSICRSILFPVSFNRICNKVSCNSSNHYNVGRSSFYSSGRSICREGTGISLSAGLCGTLVYR